MWKINYAKKIIWYALSHTIFKFIKQYWKDIDIKSIKSLSKDNYKAIIKLTPDIGSFGKNPLRIPLTGGILWLSVYDAMQGKLNQEQFEEMISATIEAPLLKKISKNKRFSI